MRLLLVIFYFIETLYFNDFEVLLYNDTDSLF